MKDIIYWTALLTWFVVIFVGMMILVIFYGILALITIAVIAALSAAVTTCLLINAIKDYKALRRAESAANQKNERD